MTDHSPAPAVSPSEYAAFDAARDDGVVDMGTVTDLENLLALKDDWNRLEAEAGAAHNFFQSFTWCSAWARAYLTEGGDAWLRTIVGRRHGKVVMIWPLMVVRHGPLCILKWLSDPVAQYGDVLVDKSDDAQVWLEAAWNKLTHDPGIDGISLRHVREDAAIHHLLTRTCRKLPDPHVARFLDLTSFESAEDHAGTLSGNQRKQRSKRCKKLESMGDIGFRVASGGDGFEDTVRLALAFKQDWQNERGLAGGVIDDPRFEQVFIDVAQGLDAEATSLAGVLALDGVPLAIDLAFRFKGHYFGFVLTQYGPARPHSPAKVLLDLHQKWCIEEGYEQFDMMLPDDPYKLHWTDKAVTVDHFAVSTSLWGTFYCTLYLRALRPFLKRLYRKMPSALRRRLIGSPFGSRKQAPASVA